MRKYERAALRLVVCALLLACAALLTGAALRLAAGAEDSESARRFREKAALLRAEALTEDTLQAIGDAPAGDAGFAVFFSVCDGARRAQVYHGTGDALETAWDAAELRASEALSAENLTPLWVKADVVSRCESVSGEAVEARLAACVPGFDFDGLAFDPAFESALLEGELNGTGIYDYDDAVLNLNNLNIWRQDAGEAPLDEAPAELIAFEAFGWFCDGDDAVYPLIRDGANYGRRVTSPLDADAALNMIDAASAYLVRQVRPDGSFIYGIFPRFDREIDNYNIVRHAGTLWSLICRYRLFPDPVLSEVIDRTIGYMLTQLRYDDRGAAYLYEAKSDEFKLGGSGIAVVALTEYMDVFHTDKYKRAALALGEGILNLQNPETGGYWHVLNGDMTRKEEQRTVYYDGEATFALARLYGLTGEGRWLDAACRAVEHFIENDYTQYRDHWVAYSLNEVTKYVTDRPEYFAFALANGQNNLSKIVGRYRTYPTNLELLISCFETWRRMGDLGLSAGDFDLQGLLDAITSRAQRQAGGYFYPEFAMYMANPRRILHTFMMRESDFRVRIDDVQHNIGGFYLYWKNYDALLKAGMVVP